MTYRNFCSSNNQNDLIIYSGTLATPTSLASNLMVLFPHLLVDIVQYNQCTITSWTHVEKLEQSKKGETKLLRTSQQNNKNFSHHASTSPCPHVVWFYTNLHPNTQKEHFVQPLLELCKMRPMSFGGLHMLVGQLCAQNAPLERASLLVLW